MKATFLPTRIFRIKLLISKYFSEHNCSLWSPLTQSVSHRCFFRADRRFMQHKGHFPARFQPSLPRWSAMSVPRWPGSGSLQRHGTFPERVPLLFCRQAPEMPLPELLLAASVRPAGRRGRAGEGLPRSDTGRRRALAPGPRSSGTHAR